MNRSASASRKCVLPLHGSLRSLRQFMLDKKCSVGVRFSQHPLSLVDGILSIPLCQYCDAHS